MDTVANDIVDELDTVSSVFRLVASGLALALARTRNSFNIVNRSSLWSFMFSGCEA